MLTSDKFLKDNHPFKKELLLKQHNKGICTPIFIADTFILIARICSQNKYPRKDEWIKKLDYIYTMEYYIIIRKNEVLKFAYTWQV